MAAAFKRQHMDFTGFEEEHWTSDSTYFPRTGYIDIEEVCKIQVATMEPASAAPDRWKGFTITQIAAIVFGVGLEMQVSTAFLTYFSSCAFIFCLSFVGRPW